MRVARASTLAAILLSFAARASDLAVVGATVYPDPDSAPIRDAVVVIRDGAITEIGPRAQTALPPDARVIDAAGTFVTAGFWNSHVHLIAPDLLEAATAGAAELDAVLDAMLNRWGFTTVFDTASVLANSLALRDRIAAHAVRGPRILTAGEPLWTTTPSYIREYLEANRIEMPPVRTRRDAARQVRRLAEGGANGIKLFTGSVQRERVEPMPLDIARAAVRAAHRLGLPVFAHAQDTAGFDVAIVAGVDVLAHPTPGTAEWTSELVSGLRAADIALIPTLTLYDVESRRDGDSDEERERLLGRVTADVGVFAAGAGPVLFGTDVGYIDHFETGLEYRLLAQAGLDHRQILAALTTAPAERFGRSEHSGRLRRGFDADLVVLEGDPGDSVENFARVRYTIRAGTIIYPAP